MTKVLKTIVVSLIAIILQTVLVLDIVLVFYFNKHFIWGTTINGKDVSGWTASEVEEALELGGRSYCLQVDERFGESEMIKGEEINYRYEVVEDINELLDQQYSGTWELMAWMDRQFEVTVVSKFDEAALHKRCQALECVKESKMIKPEDAFICFQNDKFEVVEGAKGTLLDKQILEAGIKEAVEAEKNNIELEQLGCYKEAEIKANNTLLVATAHKLNRFLTRQIIYEFGDQEEIVPVDKLWTWLNLKDKEDGERVEALPYTLTVSELKQKEIELNEEAIKTYIEQLAEKYDTLRKTRTFKTSRGVNVEVPAGDYGWKMDQASEKEALIQFLRSNEKEIHRTPLYIQEAYCRNSNDIGDTYVEVDLTGQYLWFYKKGKLIAEGDIVSGTGTNKHATPAGVFSIDYKQRNAILRGPGYACPVSYWMPFYDGMGIHDASWRGRFGGTIYLYDGSHGCINSPLSLAGTIFEEMESGVPVVCYH